MAKKFANILGLHNVFGHNGETNTYLPYYILDPVKNDINYNTICFVEADENDEEYKIGEYEIKLGDTFIITQKGVFAIVPKDGFKSNSDEPTSTGLRPIYVNNQNIAESNVEYKENDEIKEYIPGDNYKLNLKNSDYLTISTSCENHDENIITCKYELDKEKLDELYKIILDESNGNANFYEDEDGKKLTINGYSWDSSLSAFSEGNNTHALGNDSHSEGWATLALGDSSHAEGSGYGETEITREIIIKKFIDDPDEDYSDHLDIVFNYTGVDFNYFTTFNDSDITLNGAELYIGSDLEYAIAEIVAAKYIEGYDETMPTGTYIKINFYNDYSFESLIDQDGGKLAFALLRSGSYGNISHSEGDLTIAKGKASHTEGSYSLSEGPSSHAEGYATIASGQASHSEGYHNISNGDYSHTEGESTVASGQASHAEGLNTKAYGYNSHAEGHDNKAYGVNSHAEGTYTITVGEASHAEGFNTKAYGSGSHAEGQLSEAHGKLSHAEGWHTVTNNVGEHAEGRYNLSTFFESYKTEEEKLKYTTISSIGIGKDNDSRANAIEVMRNGDVYIKGIGGYDGTNVFEATNVQKVISDLNSLITNLSATLVERGLIDE